jgi:hypothetical protein
MKNVILLLSVLSLMGCAAGTDDPTGDDNLGTDPGGDTTRAPSSGAASTGSDTSTNAMGTAMFNHTSVLDPAPQIIPNRPGHGPAAPDPGPVHIGPGVPR